MIKIKPSTVDFLKASILGMLAFSCIFPSMGQAISPISKVNSSFDEQHPVISPTGNLFFTVAFHPQNHNGSNDPGDVWTSNRSGEAFQAPARIPEISTVGYDVAVGFLDDRNLLIYHDGKGRKQGIHQYSRSGDSWQYKEQLNLGNFRNQSPHFSGRLSPSGDVLILSLTSFGSYGNEDIYVSFLRENGNWSTPQNLGPQINSYQQEMTPFLSPDKQLLFFSTNGHGSSRGRDIFYAKRLDDTWESWTVPQPISKGNTLGVELAYFQLPGDSGKAILTTTQNSEGYGDLLMVEAEMITGLEAEPFAEKKEPINKNTLNKVALKEPAMLPVPLEEEAPPKALPQETPKETVRPEPVKEKQKAAVDVPDEAVESDEVSDIQLKVLDIHTFEEIDYSIIQVDSSGTKSAKMRSTAFRNGFPIDPTRVRGIIINAAGYLPLSLKATALTRLEEPILMSPASKGVSMVLEDVLFKRGTAELLEENSTDFITGLAAFLLENPSIKILLEGHTDNLGNVRLSKELSIDRASAIRDILVEEGVDFERVRIAGWGGSKPIASNQTEEGRVKNRRVEMVIVDQ